MAASKAIPRVALRLNLKLGGRPLYAKSSNERVAQLLVLDRELSGTDLSTMIRLVAERAKALADA